VCVGWRGDIEGIVSLFRKHLLHIAVDGTNTEGASTLFGLGPVGITDGDDVGIGSLHPTYQVVRRDHAGTGEGYAEWAVDRAICLSGHFVIVLGDSQKLKIKNQRGERE
jgi:hypothetical protein